MMVIMPFKIYKALFIPKETQTGEKTENTEFCSFGASCPGYRTVHGLENITGLHGIFILLVD